MSSQTSNLGLSKPDIGDTPGVTIPQLASNFDKIDSSLASIAYNVKSYGAKGDGITDDSTAINNAVTACANNGGGIVYFPKGVYMGWVNLYQMNNVTLKGAGIDATTIRLNNANKNVVATLQDNANWPSQDTFNIAIEDMTIDGNYNNIAANTAGNTGTFNDNYQLGLYIMLVRGCRVERVRVTNTWCTNDFYWNNKDDADGMEYQTIIRDCIFDHCGDKGVNLNGSTTYYPNLELDNDTRNVTVENCVFVGSDSTMTANGKQLVNFNCSDSNTIYQKNIKFLHNTFYNQAVGLYGEGNLMDWLIEGNEFYNVGQCVYLYGNQSNSHGGYPQNVEISSNKVNNSNTASFSGEAVLRVTGAKTRFHDNTIEALNCLYGYGILADIATDSTGANISTDSIISHNRIKCNGFLANSGGGIALMGDGLIEGNTVECVDNTQVGKGIYTDEPSVTTGRKYRVYNNQIRNFTISNALNPIGVTPTVVKDNNLLTADGHNMGIATMVNGACTINNTNIQSTDMVLLTHFSDSAAQGVLRVVGYTAGVSFTVQSSQATDNGQFWWKIIH